MNNDVNCSLFVGDLSIFCDETDLQNAFSSFGEIRDIRIQRGKGKHSHSLSYGFVEFSTHGGAENALTNMNGFELKGRKMM